MWSEAKWGTSISRCWKTMKRSAPDKYQSPTYQVRGEYLNTWQVASKSWHLKHVVNITLLLGTSYFFQYLSDLSKNNILLETNCSVINSLALDLKFTHNILYQNVTKSSGTNQVDTRFCSKQSIINNNKTQLFFKYNFYQLETLTVSSVKVYG